jgi:hypothetical protein
MLDEAPASSSISLQSNSMQVDCTLFPCNDVGMAERNMQIVRFMGTTPSVAYCDVCRLTFRTRQEFISDPDKAKEQLLADFARHECKPEPDIVNSTLAQIK